MVTKKNLAGTTWGLSVETGLPISIQDFDQTSAEDEHEHKNEQGETAGLVGYNDRHDYNFSGVVNDDIDIDLLSSVTLVNALATLGGLTGGTNLVRELTLKKTNTALMILSGKITRWSALTVA